MNSCTAVRREQREQYNFYFHKNVRFGSQDDSYISYAPMSFFWALLLILLVPRFFVFFVSGDKQLLSGFRSSLTDGHVYHIIVLFITILFYGHAKKLFKAVRFFFYVRHE